MQLWILHTAPIIAATMLWQKDKVRAGKQLIETNQALAALGYDIRKWDGGLYGRKAQRNKRVTLWIGTDETTLAWTLAYQVTLAQLMPEHKAGITFLEFFDSNHDLPHWQDGTVPPGFIFVPLKGYEDERNIPVPLKYHEYLSARRKRIAERPQPAPQEEETC